ncbi:Trm112 family protein [Kangiella sp. TOML190]|uniref:Trm112 family protein n=1 Tax=Kangiella sp. TOML190 TaxID=2931351 RepID=UPI00203F0454|nr:Trm112 family protein [Kangiella sp. TOML190]
MNSKLLDVLVCPLCKGHLVYHRDANELVCRFDKLAYPIRDDIPVMLEDQARELGIAELDALKNV